MYYYYYIQLLLVCLFSSNLIVEGFEDLLVWKPTSNTIKVSFQVDNVLHHYHLYPATQLYNDRPNAMFSYASRTDSFFQGALTFLDDGDDEYSGIFILQNNSILTLNGRRHEALHRELSGESSVKTVTFDFTNDYSRQLAQMSCQFPNHNTVFDIGIVYDPSTYQGFGSNSKLVERYVEHMVVTGNVILKKFAKVSFRIAHIEYADTMTCPNTGSNLQNMQGALDQTTSFARDGRLTVAHWHRISACDNWGSYAGLAWVNTMCSQSSFSQITGTSKVTTYQYTFRTFIHEMGHSFGCIHPFSSSSDQGQYGGIMDYGDGKLLGTEEYGYTNASLEYFCNKINSLESSNSCPYSSTFGGDVGSTCGDRFVTGTEQCECPDGSLSCGSSPYTCIDCKLSYSSMECSNEFLVALTNGPEGGVQSEDGCCTQEGVLHDVETSCNDGNGYCSMGVCTNRCQDYFANLELCGTQGCRQQCISSSGYCTSSLWIRHNGEVTYVTDVADGSKCRIDSNLLGHCESGQCIENNTPIPTNPTNSPTSSTTRPSSSQTPSPTLKPTSTTSTKQPSSSGSTSNPTTNTISPTIPTSKPTTSTNSPTNKPTLTPTYYTLTHRPTLQPTSSALSFDWLQSPVAIGVMSSVVFIVIIILIVICFLCCRHKVEVRPLPVHRYSPISF